MNVKKSSQDTWIFLPEPRFNESLKRVSCRLSFFAPLFCDEKGVFLIFTDKEIRNEKKIKVYLPCYLSTAVAVSSFTGISVFAADKTSGEEETRTVVDATGAEVEVPAHPKRIAVPAMVLPNMVYALQGNAENMVSIPPAAYSGWEMSILKDLAPELEDVDTTMVNDDFSVNVEALADADVDLVLNWDSETDQAEQLKALGIPCVLVSSAKDMDGLKNLVTMLGDALNCEDRAKQATDWYDETMDYFNSKADEVAALSEDEMPRVLHFQNVHEMTCYTGGINTYITTLEGGRISHFLKTLQNLQWKQS